LISLVKIKAINEQMKSESFVADKVSNIGVNAARFILIGFTRVYFFFLLPRIIEFCRKLCSHYKKLTAVIDTDNISVSSNFIASYFIITIVWVCQTTVILTNLSTSVENYLCIDFIDEEIRKMIGETLLYAIVVSVEVIQTSTATYAVAVIVFIMHLLFVCSEAFCKSLQLSLQLHGSKHPSSLEIFNQNFEGGSGDLVMFPSIGHQFREFYLELSSLAEKLCLGVIPISILISIMLSYDGLTGQQNEFSSPGIAYLYGFSQFGAMIPLIISSEALVSQVGIKI